MIEVEATVQESERSNERSRFEFVRTRHCGKNGDKSMDCLAKYGKPTSQKPVGFVANKRTPSEAWPRVPCTKCVDGPKRKEPPLLQAKKA